MAHARRPPVHRGNGQDTHRCAVCPLSCRASLTISDSGALLARRRIVASRRALDNRQHGSRFLASASTLSVAHARAPLPNQGEAMKRLLSITVLWLLAMTAVAS